ncbi:MAG: gephyrin-like molybdotransferase Glp [bacterium]
MTEVHRLVLDAPLPFDEAVRRVRAEVAPLAAEEVALEEAYDRVLATEVRATESLPPFAASTADGWAVRSADVQGASDASPVELDVVGDLVAGSAPGPSVGPGRAVRIMTGAPVPDGADCVVMLEWTEWTERRVRVQRSATAGSKVRRVGEDVTAGDVVLRPGRCLAPADVGLLASLGIAHVTVRRRPGVALLVSGDELLEPTDPPQPGKIRSSNDWALAGQIRSAGGLPQRLGIARDDLADLATRLSRARGADVLVTSGGVSVGDRDLLREALSRAGFREILWRVASSPGKPLLFGRLGATLVFGLPGNPVSSMVAFENFVRPVLRLLQGDARPDRPRIRARVVGALSGAKDRRHFARVRVAYGEHGYSAREVGPGGSGNLRSMVEANGLAVVHEGRGRVEAGETVEVMLLGAPESETDAV